MAGNSITAQDSCSAAPAGPPHTCRPTRRMMAGRQPPTSANTNYLSILVTNSQICLGLSNYVTLLGSLGNIDILRQKKCLDYIKL